MKHHLSFSVVLLPFVVLQSSGLQCGREEYSFSDRKCCRKCAPGTEMKFRCSADMDTRCQACEEGYYNLLFTTWPCKKCSSCDPARGLQEVKKCQRTSDTVCTCLPGYQPAVSETEEKRCDPCPEGHFSKGGDKACAPWTNCTATGRNTFRIGTKEEDTVCHNSPTMPHATAFPTKHSSPRETVRATYVTKATSKPRSAPLTLTALSTKGLPDGVKKSDYFLYILIAATLLLALGGIVLLKAFRKTKKYKEPGRFAEQMQKDGKNSFRIPIQEEQIDAKSSLVQN